MVKIRRHKHHSVPTLNMASMPDLIFTVLFFFMIVTHMRTETPRLDIDVPQGTDLTKPQHRRFVTTLYVGKDDAGNTKIQMGENIIPLEAVGSIVSKMKSKLNDDDAEYFTINIRADKGTKMGVITDIKQQLRKAGALKIRYNAVENK